MKKTIIVLFLVLLTLGLCVSCDASVDKKLLGGATSGSGAGGSTVTITISLCDGGIINVPGFVTIDAPVGKTWEQFIASSLPANFSIDGGSGYVKYYGEVVCKNVNLNSYLSKTETIGGTTEYYMYGAP